MSNHLKIINTSHWIEENQDQFKPPVCNKLMHNGQLVVMFVGGPNAREDYHIEEGEELFYQIKGQMSVKILENGQHKEIVIKEGELFLLPARVPHSPQRPANTIGLVIERLRSDNEIDGVRWFIPDSPQTLYEKWFHCTDLGVQLAPIIKEFFASEEFKTKIPKDNVLSKLPFELNNVLIEKVKHGAFNLAQFIKENSSNEKKLVLTHSDLKLQFNVEVLFEGEHKIENLLQDNIDEWLWQLDGHTEVSVINKTGLEESYKMNEKDSIFIPSNYCNKIQLKVLTGNLIRINQNPKLK